MYYSTALLYNLKLATGVCNIQLTLKTTPKILTVIMTMELHVVVEIEAYC